MLIGVMSRVMRGLESCQSYALYVNLPILSDTHYPHTKPVINVPGHHWY